MYSEKHTKDIAVQRMLNNIENDIDKSEGSFTNDIISAVASDLEQAYLELDGALGIVFAETSFGEYLDKRVNEFGIDRKRGEKAVDKLRFTGSAGAVIPKGTIVETESGLQYITMESATISESFVDIYIEAGDIGTEYNVPAHTVTNLTQQITGVVSVTNLNPITSGVDTESDSSLLERFRTKVRTPASSGSKAQYKMWALEVVGIGDAKVYPTWHITEQTPNGEGTVKVLCISSERKGISTEKAQEVYEYIETVRPIGAKVTVESATEKPINISVGILHDNTRQTELIKSEFEQAVTQYLQGIAFKQDYVSFGIIGGHILEIEGVNDYSDLTLNTESQNVTIQDTEVAVLGEVEIVWQT